MNPDDVDIAGEEVHRGHDPEAGLLARVREWIDILPWLRLGRTLRVAGSPPLVSLMAATYAVWWVGQGLMFDSRTFRHGVLPIDPGSSQLSAVPQNNVVLLSEYLQGLIPTSMFELGAGSMQWHAVFGVLWSLLVWTPAALLLARQGALLTAGRSMVGMKPGISHVMARTPAAWMTAMVPLACVFAMGILIVALGWLSRIVDGIGWLEFLLAIVVVLIAIPCGILAFGAHVAVPLSWAALVNERDPDTLDSLSRGYEYLYRRPLRLVMYVLASLAVLVVVAFLASAIAWSASAVATSLLTLSGGSINVTRVAVGILRHLPTVVVLTTVWSLVGGVYLLLRYDAGGQEVEDLWQPATSSKPLFPVLPKAHTND